MVVLGLSPGSLSLRVPAMATHPPPSMDHTLTLMATPQSQNTSHHLPQRDALLQLGEGTPRQRALTLTASMAKWRDQAWSWTQSPQDLEDKRAKMKAQEFIHHPQPVLQTKQVSRQAKSRLPNSFQSYFEIWVFSPPSPSSFSLSPSLPPLTVSPGMENTIVIYVNHFRIRIQMLFNNHDCAHFCNICLHITIINTLLVLYFIIIILLWQFLYNNLLLCLCLWEWLNLFIFSHVDTTVQRSNSQNTMQG